MSKADQTKAKILDAALEEFAAYGVAGARVDRISAAAGCNKNLLYVYFGSKENLFTTVLDQHLLRVYEDIPFTPDDLPGFAGRVFDFAMAHPDLMRLLAWSTLETTVSSPTGRASSHDAKIEAIHKAQSAGQLNPLFSAEVLVTTLMAVATAWSPAFPFGSSHQPPGAKLRAQVVDMIGRLATAPDPT